jgi:hypothetical protein
MASIPVIPEAFATEHIDLVIWVDSFGASGWQSREDYVESVKSTSMLCRSVGFIVFEDDTRLALALSENSSGYNADIVIPKVAIKERISLVRLPQDPPKMAGAQATLPY